MTLNKQKFIPCLFCGL